MLESYFNFQSTGWSPACEPVFYALLTEADIKNHFMND
jgi:hypothetical protein